MVENFVLRRRASGAENATGDYKADELPPQLTLFSTVIPIIMHFFHISKVTTLHPSLVRAATSNHTPANQKQRFIMTSVSRQFIAEYMSQIFDVIKSDVALYT